MSLILIVIMFAGGALGLIVSAALGCASVVLVNKNAKTRLYVWWVFAATILILLPVCFFAVQSYPYAPVRPGSDYDVAMKNLFIQGLGYCSSLGIAALLGASGSFLMPSKTFDKSQ